MNSHIKTHKICKFDSQKKDIFPPKANFSGKIIIFTAFLGGLSKLWSGLVAVPETFELKLEDFLLLILLAVVVLVQ